MSDPNKITAPHKTWSEADEVTLLKAAKEFRKRTGSEPKIGTIREFFDKIEGSVAPHLDPDKAYYKLKRLKSKFLLNGSVAPSGAHERVLYNLSKDVWHGLSGGEKKRADAGMIYCINFLYVYWEVLKLRQKRLMQGKLS
jgi:Protein of unknown function, DUF573